MRMTIAALIVLLCGCASGVANTDITSQSRNSILVVATEPSPIPYQLSISSFDPDTGSLGAPPADAASIVVGRKDPGAYHLSIIEPGTYVVRDVTQQLNWSVCFHDNSVSFNVAPGEVVYLGRFDPRPHLQQLQQIARSTGRTRTGMGQGPHHFFDNILPPALTPPAATDVDSVRAFLAGSFPRITAPVRMADLRAAQFGIGRPLLGAAQICGGWFTERAEPR